MPAKPLAAGLGATSREVYQIRGGALPAADHAAPEINGLAARPVTLLVIV